jgi:hypothetical protein
MGETREAEGRSDAEERRAAYAQRVEVADHLVGVGAIEPALRVGEGLLVEDGEPGVGVAEGERGAGGGGHGPV